MKEILNTTVLELGIGIPGIIDIFII
jgi:hypothetical protein